MSITAPIIPKIEKTRTPAFPQFLFEWHPHTSKAYIIDLPGDWDGTHFVPKLDATTADGTCIAEHVETHAQFLGFVQTYLRGYRKRDSEARP